jgi:hypothetical protein
VKEDLYGQIKKSSNTPTGVGINLLPMATTKTVSQLILKLISNGLIPIADSPTALFASDKREMILSKKSNQSLTMSHASVNKHPLSNNFLEEPLQSLKALTDIFGSLTTHPRVTNVFTSS